MSARIKVHLALSLLVAATTAAAQQEHQHHGQHNPSEGQHTGHQHADQSSGSGDAQHSPPVNRHEHGAHQHADQRTERSDTQRSPSKDEHSAHQDGDQRTESERAHVPPPPPQYVMPDMSEEEMAEMMDMDDTAPFGMALLDHVEWRDTEGDTTLAWDGRAWYGNDYHKALLKTEGERTAGEYEGSAELLWDRVISRWWSLQAGVAHDFGEGPSRSWAAFGVQGLAPYWFEVEALVYAGEQGRTAATVSAEYEMFLTQRLVLQPKLELDVYGKDDPANDIGSGLSDAELGLRLRYEIRREFAPYIGVLWSRKFGQTADLVREHGDDANDLQFIAGLRAWF